MSTVIQSKKKIEEEHFFAFECALTLVELKESGGHHWSGSFLWTPGMNNLIAFRHLILALY